MTKTAPLGRGLSPEPYPLPEASALTVERRALLSRIRKIELVTRRKVNEQLAGQYHSVFKGRGMSFDEVRPYQPGDEIRFIDWNVTARSDEPFVKRFTEERELTVMLLVDASASLRIGSRAQEKREVAAELAALLAFSAIKNNDRVGLGMFSDQLEHVVPPKKGQKHVLRLVSDVLTHQAKHRGTNLEEALTWMSRSGSRRSICFVISDFLAPPHTYERALRVAARRHDLVPIVVRDPMERELPRVGLMLGQDLETGEQVWIDTDSPRVRRLYTERYDQQLQELRSFMRKLKLDAIEVETGTSYVKPLVQFFELRTRRS